MRIALFCEALSQQSTGAAMHTRVLADGLRQLGHSVLCVSSDTEADTGYTQGDVFFCPAKIDDSIFGQSARERAYPDLRDALNAFSPDIIHAHSFGALGLLALKYARHSAVPLYCTIHDLYDTQMGCGASKLARSSSRSALRGALTKILEGAKAAGATSPRTKDVLRSLSLCVPLWKFPPCVDNLLFSSALPEPDLALLRERFEVLPGRGLFLYAGALHEGSGVAALLELWKQAVSPQDKAHLLIAGDGAEAAVLAEKANILGVSGQVTFCGVLSQKALADCFAASRGFLSACPSPAMKYAPLEAIACGAPMLIPSGCANESALVPGVNGFVYKTPEEFTRYLKMLIALDDKGRTLLRRLVAKTAAGLTPATLAESAVQFYASAK